MAEYKVSQHVEYATEQAGGLLIWRRGVVKMVSADYIVGYHVDSSGRHCRSSSWGRPLDMVRLYVVPVVDSESK